MGTQVKDQVSVFCPGCEKPLVLVRVVEKYNRFEAPGVQFQRPIGPLHCENCGHVPHFADLVK